MYMYVVHKIFMVSQLYLMKSVQLEQWESFRESFRYEIENNWESNSDKIKRNKCACLETQWLPEGTTDTVLYFLTTCTALRHFGILKYLLMSVIIEKRVSREPRHWRKLHLNHQQTWSSSILSLWMTIELLLLLFFLRWWTVLWFKDKWLNLAIRVQL